MSIRVPAPFLRSSLFKLNTICCEAIDCAVMQFASQTIINANQPVSERSDRDRCVWDISGVHFLNFFLANIPNKLNNTRLYAFFCSTESLISHSPAKLSSELSSELSAHDSLTSHSARKWSDIWHLHIIPKISTCAQTLRALYDVNDTSPVRRETCLAHIRGIRARTQLCLRKNGWLRQDSIRNISSKAPTGDDRTSREVWKSRKYFDRAAIAHINYSAASAKRLGIKEKRFRALISLEIHFAFHLRVEIHSIAGQYRKWLKSQ